MLTFWLNVLRTALSNECSLNEARWAELSVWAGTWLHINTHVAVRVAATSCSRVHRCVPLKENLTHNIAITSVHVISLETELTWRTNGKSAVCGKRQKKKAFGFVAPPQPGPVWIMASCSQVRIWNKTYCDSSAILATCRLQEIKNGPKPWHYMHHRWENFVMQSLKLWFSWWTE